jgi:hypothetical protein
MATITGDRSTLFTAPEVQAIIERERTYWSIALSVAIPVLFFAGVGFGIWFAQQAAGG